jgi:hypothetical protein
MGDFQKGLLIKSNDNEMGRLLETFIIEKTYGIPLSDLTCTYVYIASPFPHDARRLKTGYIGKIKSITVSKDADKWKYKFLLSELLTSIMDYNGLPRSAAEAMDGDIFEADFDSHISPTELGSSINPALRINHFEECTPLTIIDAITQISKTYKVEPSQVKICING